MRRSFCSPAYAVFVGQRHRCRRSPRSLPSTEIPQDQVGDLLFSLVEKSLVHADLAPAARPAIACSNRPDTMRGRSSRDGPATHRRHAEHFVVRFAQATAAWETTPTQQWIARYEADIDNLRGALEWAFGAGWQCRDWARSCGSQPRALGRARPDAGASALGRSSARQGRQGDPGHR